MMNKFHPYHIVSLSPWPIVTSFSLLSVCMLLVYYMLICKMMILESSAYSLMLIMCCAFFWWSDVVSESSVGGFHNQKVINGLKYGMILFIFSEVLFFVAFFWTYFHLSLSPVQELGQSWPPTGINFINPMNMPLLNTVILLSSGISITASHHFLLENKTRMGFNCLSFTFLLGLYFTVCQVIEYFSSQFSINDSCMGSIFYMATGFHGFHVIIGSLFLMICWVRMMNYQNSFNHMIGFELAAWYWHFVDVVWLVLYCSLYWWGS